MFQVITYPQQQQPAPLANNAPLATNNVQPQTVRKHLTLTKEQMLEAQEMFRTANKVTRPEKALILGFMAGSRDNPCPHLGRDFIFGLINFMLNVCAHFQAMW